FVGLGRPESPDLRRDLPDLLPVDAADHNLGHLWNSDRDPVRNRVDDVVTEPELDLQVLALQCRAIADAADLQLFLKPLRDALDQIGDERAMRAPHRSRTIGFVARIDTDLPGLDLRRNFVIHHDLKGALRTLHLDGLAFDIGSYPCRH